MLILKRISKFLYQYSGLPNEEKLVRETLSILVDGYQFTAAYRDFDWDGKHKFYNGKHRTFKFGFIDKITRQCEKSNIKYQLIDDIKLVQIKPKDLRINLHLHQKEGVVEFFKKNFGIVFVPTRGGKTYLSGECIRIIIENIKDINVLFVVDGIDLVKQTTDELSKYLNIHKNKIGRIQGEHFETKQVTIATIQTIQSCLSAKIRKTKKPITAIAYRKKLEDLRFKKKRMLDYFKSVKFGIFDEIHESMASESRQKVLSHFDFDFLLGLSATPYKSGETEESISTIENMNLLGSFGGICYTVEESVLKERGVLAHDKALIISIDHDSNKLQNAINSFSEPEESSKRYQYYKDRIIFNNQFRDSTLLQLISIVRKLKLKTLFLFESVEHGRNIEKMSGEKFLSGVNNQDERKHYTKHFLSGSGKILLASNIYKKGITLPEVQILVNVDGGEEDSLIIQKRGRALGTTKTKKRALIIDFFDVCEDYFSKHASNRLKVYELKIGTENIDVINSEDVDFNKMLFDYLSNWQNVK
jgi:superfamily II DNA or RNA helicase